MRQASENAGQGLSLKRGLVIAGPTGSGKTDLAVALARRLDAELISADSRQVYRELDAGTAKARPEGVVQHLVDVAAPGERYDVGRFQREALTALAEIRARGRVPILVGGTGLYIKAFLEGLSELPGRDESVRERLQERLERDGEPALRGRLAEADPQAAAQIPSGNRQRLIRALEVLELTGKPISEAWSRRRGAATGSWLALRIDWPADTLRPRLQARCRAMWPALLEEVRALRARYSGSEPGFESLGYREAVAVADGTVGDEAGYEAFERATLAYAKRQRTWFRNQLNGEPIDGGSTEAMAAQALRALARADA